jgi:spermidine synthase
MLNLKELFDAFRVKHETVFSKGTLLQVVYNDDLVMLKLDGATNSRINKKSIYTGGYWDYFLPLAYAYKNPRILLIGLGIGTTPYQLHSLLDGFKLDIVEYDEQVVKFARKYSPSKIRDNIIVEDGFEYVARTEKKYDIIMLDAYGKGARIPKQFYCEDFVKNAHRILGKEGVLLINYAMHPYGIIKFGGYAKLLSGMFRSYRVKVEGSSDMQIVVCSKSLGKGALIKRIRSKMKRTSESRKLMREYSLMERI